jgi:hypothetical protein
MSFIFAIELGNDASNTFGDRNDFPPYVWAKTAANPSSGLLI